MCEKVVLHTFSSYVLYTEPGSHGMPSTTSSSTWRMAATSLRALQASSVVLHEAFLILWVPHKLASLAVYLPEIP